MKTKRLSKLNSASLMLLCIATIACSSPKDIEKNFTYFKNGQDTVNVTTNTLRIKAFDIIRIRVTSGTLNQDQTAVFNIHSENAGIDGYLVNSDGFMILPLVGKVSAIGRTQTELQDELQRVLQNYVKLPTVAVTLPAFNVNVIGEVKTPGVQKFTTTRVSIMDALSSAGDLTDFGRRDDVTIIREVGGNKVFHKIDLRDKNLFQSPVYFLEPNDIVYVSPNEYKLRNLRIDPEAQRKTGLFFTVASLILSVASIIVFATRNN